MVRNRVFCRAWLLASGFCGAPVLGTGADAEPVHWELLALIGVACMLGYPLPVAHPRDAALGGLLFLLVALLSPWPVGFGPLLVALGLGVGIVNPDWGRRVGGGLALSGVVLIVLGIVMFGYESLTARSAILPSWISESIVQVARFAQADLAVDGGNIVLFSMRAKHPVAATWSLFADPASVCFLVAGCLLILMDGLQRWRTALLFAAGMFVWLIFRAAGLLAVYLHLVLRTKYDAPLEHAGMFWSEWVHLPLLLPAVLFGWRLTKGAAPAAEPAVVAATEAPASTDPLAARGLAALALLLVAALLLTLAVFYKPSGERKAGRVLIDEYHCRVDDWTRQRWYQKEFDTTSTLRPYDTEWYGEAAAYNYASLYEYCSRFYTMGRIEKPIDSATLEDCDVLVLKVPSKYYSDDEIAAVRAFVANGGGLFLLGEHTSVFGSSVPLNQLARYYGFEFRYDCLFGMDEVYKQAYEPPMIPHPVIQHVGPMEFAISCSIDPGLSAGWSVMRSSGLKNLDADYHVPNFYPQPNDNPRMLHGSFVQLWSTAAGKGRVLAFTDSTIFANFSFYDPGKSQLFLGILEWLNHRPGMPLWWLTLLGLVLAGAGVFLLRGAGWLLALGAVLLGWWLGAVTTRELHRSGVPELVSQQPIFRVAVERELCPGAKLPVGGFIGGGADEFGLFERSVQRLTTPHTPKDPGVTWATARGDLDACLDPKLAADLVLFIHPSEPVDGADAAQLADYVKAGGRVLVLDSALNTSSTANDLVGGLGLTVDRSKTVAGQSKSADGFPVLPIEGAYRVVGGEPITTVDGEVVAAWKQHGKGLVCVVGFGSRFADAKMGVSANIEPDAEARSVYEFEYALLRSLGRRRL